MKITGTIVDKNMALIGLVLKGKPIEFGMMGKQNWTVNPFSLSDAKKLIKKNGCSDFELDSNDNIIGKNNKKLSDLPMYDKKGNSINNQIKIKSAIEDNGKLVGAIIVFIGSGIEKKLKLEDLQLVYSYCEPTNFMLRNRDNEYYITGKGETKKEDIPVEKIDNQKSSPKKSKKELIKEKFWGNIGIGTSFAEYISVSDEKAGNIIVPIIGSSFIQVNSFLSLFSLHIDDIWWKYFEEESNKSEIGLSDIYIEIGAEDLSPSCLKSIYNNTNKCATCPEWTQGCKMYLGESFELGDANSELTAYYPLYDTHYDIDYIEMLYKRLRKIADSWGLSLCTLYLIDSQYIKDTGFNIKMTGNFKKYIANSVSSTLFKKGEKYGLDQSSYVEYEETSPIFTDETGKPICKYFSPTKKYPLGYFKEL